MSPSSISIVRRAGRDFVLRSLALAALAGGLSWAVSGRPAHASTRRGPRIEFLPGAADHVRETRPLVIDPEAAAEADRLLQAMARSPSPQAWRADLLERGSRLVPVLIAALLSEDEAYARAAADSLRAWCAREQLVLGDGTSPVDLGRFGLPRIRAETYDRFAAWWRRRVRD